VAEETRMVVADDAGGWRRRFKGKVTRLAHEGGSISVRVELYSQARPAESGLTTAREQIAAQDARNEAQMATLGKSNASDEQVLFLSTVDPAARLLLRVVARRDTPVSATVELQVRSSKYPHLLPVKHIQLRLGAGEIEFVAGEINPFGYNFAAIPVATLGSLWIEIAVQP